MKRPGIFASLIIVFIMFCLHCSIKAQNIVFGPRTGINIINTYKTAYDKSLYSFGYDFGLYAEKSVYKNFSIGLECNLTQKKQAFSTLTYGSFFKTVDAFLTGFGSLLPVDISIEDILESALGSSSELINDTVFNYYRGMTHYTYIELPLLLSYKYKKLVIEAGPCFSFLAGATTYSLSKQEIPLLDMLPKEVFDTIDYGAYIYGTMTSLFPAYSDTLFDETSSVQGISKFNTGIVAGLNYQICNNLSLTLRYSHMFSYVNTDGGNKNRHSLVNVGLKYNLGSLIYGKPLL